MTAHFLAPLSTVFAFPSSRFTHAPQANSCCEAGEKDNKLENIKSTELIVHLGATSHRLARVRAQPDVDVDVFGSLWKRGAGGTRAWSAWFDILAHIFPPDTSTRTHTHSTAYAHCPFIWPVVILSRFTIENKFIFDFLFACRLGSSSGRNALATLPCGCGSEWFSVLRLSVSDFYPF